MDKSPSPVEAPSSPTVEAHPTALERLEARYPNLYSTLMQQSSQKPLMRALEELETKEANERRVEAAEKELRDSNDAVYASLAAVDAARKERDNARQEDRNTVYRYLPY